MTETIAQIIGILAMGVNILSFQCKRSKNLLLAQGVGSLMFSLNYILLGDVASAGFNIVNIARSAGGVSKKGHNKFFFAVVCMMYTLVAVFTYKSLWSFAVLFAQIAGTYAMWYKDGAFVRRNQFFVISPIWLINNLWVTFTIGGILCEVFTLTSVIISFIRYGKNGFDKV